MCYFTLQHNMTKGITKAPDSNHMTMWSNLTYWDFWWLLGKKEGMISVIGQTTDADTAAKDNCS